MSRSGYSDDCDGIQLWRANVERAIQGKKGQEFFKELLAALDALPNKRLIAHELVSEQGECCALGAVFVARNIDVANVDESEPEEVAAALSIRSMLAQEIAYWNDEYRRNDTPEERWQRMHLWVESNLTPGNTGGEHG
jgi:hypothetical protein